MQGLSTLWLRKALLRAPLGSWTDSSIIVSPTNRFGFAYLLLNWTGSDCVVTAKGTQTNTVHVVIHNPSSSWAVSQKFNFGMEPLSKVPKKTTKTFSQFLKRTLVTAREVSLCGATGAHPQSVFERELKTFPGKPMAKQFQIFQYPAAHKF